MNDRINLLALTREQLVALLTKVGSANYSMEMLDSDIAYGMPLNADGTVNLIYYAAWLLRGDDTQ